MFKRFFIVLVVLLTIYTAFAGDVAAFVDLGFSEDCGEYIFAQYGITDKFYQGYAEIYTVDIASNSFTKNGVYKTTPSEATKGKSGYSVYEALYNANKEHINTYKPIPTSVNNILYIRPGVKKQGTDTIKVKDFEFSSTSNPVSYSFNLCSFSEGEGDSIKSSFYITLEKSDKDGNVLCKKVVGSPDIKRKGIKDYAIEKIICCNEGKSLVFIVEKISEDEKGPVIRYMVETIILDK